jgi:branched-chain amino acid transport system permease protein
VAWITLEVVVASPFGRTLAAIRLNASRVTALGGRVYAYRLAAFAVSGAIAALAGAMKVQHTNFLSPDLGSWFVSGDVLIAVVIGGIGTLVGGVLGATLLVFLKDFLSGIFGYWYLFLGIIFIAIAIFMPRGILGTLFDRLDRLQDRRSENGGTR